MYGAMPLHGTRAHSVTLIDSIAWMFGGCDERGCWRDVFCFNTGACLPCLERVIVFRRVSWTSRCMQPRNDEGGESTVVVSGETTLFAVPRSREVGLAISKHLLGVRAAGCPSGFLEALIPMFAIPIVLARPKTYKVPCI